MISDSTEDASYAFAKPTIWPATSYWVTGRSPFWYRRVVREHLNRAAHKVSDEEIISIVEYVRKGGDQPTTEQLRSFLSSEVLKRGRTAGR